MTLGTCDYPVDLDNIVWLAQLNSEDDHQLGSQPDFGTHFKHFFIPLRQRFTYCVNER